MARKKKKRPGRGTLLLALLLGLLGVTGTGVWYGRNQGTLEDELERQALLFPDLDPAAVVALSIEHPDEPVLELRKGTESGKWEIVAPVSGAAEHGRVEEILVRLEQVGLIASEPLPAAATGAGAEDAGAKDAGTGDAGAGDAGAGDGLARYGLAPPAARVTVRSAGGWEGTVVVGSAVPGAQAVYAVREGSGTLSQVHPDLGDALAQGYAELRSHQVFDLTPDAVQSVQVLAPEHTMMLARSDEGWKLREPQVGPADRRRAGDLVSALCTARAHAYLEAEGLSEAEMGLEWPQVRVRLADREGAQTEWLEIGGVTPQGLRYARRGDVLLTVSPVLVQQLQRSPDGLRDRDALDLAFDRVDRIHIVQGAGGTSHDLIRTLVDDRVQWELRQGERVHPASASRVGGFLQELDRLEVSEFVDSTGEFAADVTVQLYVGADRVGAIALQDDAPGSHLVLAAIDGQSAIEGQSSIEAQSSGMYRVQRQSLEVAKAPELSFRERTVFGAPPEDLLGAGTWTLALDRPWAGRPGPGREGSGGGGSGREGSGGERERLRLSRDTAGEWTSIPAREVDSAAVDALALELLHLKPADFVAQATAELPPVMDQDETVSVTLELTEAGSSGDAATRRWQVTFVGEAIGAPGSQVATSEGFDLVFTVGEATRRRFLAGLWR